MQEGLLTLAPWALVVYGATLAVTGSVLAEPLRMWLARRWRLAGKLVSCPMCFGWWVGLGWYFAAPTLSPIQGVWYVAAPANAFAALTVCWVFHVVLAKLGAEDL
jgi:hypothetical protein